MSARDGRPARRRSSARLGRGRPEDWARSTTCPTSDLWRRAPARARGAWSTSSGGACGGAGLDRGCRASRRSRGPTTRSTPTALTICFARRFATYKRATLLLSASPTGCRKLLLSADRPVQFVFAGKAHPADDGGKELIRQIVNFSHDPEVRHRFVFLDDYDMAVARAHATRAPTCG